MRKNAFGCMQEIRERGAQQILLWLNVVYLTHIFQKWNTEDCPP